LHPLVRAVEWQKWVLYVSGILLGGLVEFVANWDEWPCVSDIAALLEAAYLTYFYLASYFETGDGEHIAYATLYIIQGFEIGFNIQCGANADTVASSGPSNYFKEYSLTNEPNQTFPDIAPVTVLADENSVYNAFDWVRRILGELEEILGLLETVVDVFTIISEWNDGDYFEAGLFTGKGAVNAFFTIWAIVDRFTGA